MTDAIAPSQALPFRITVLDGPLASQILLNIRGPEAEVVSPSVGVVELRGRALPYRPMTYSGKQRVQTTWYAGNTVATQQTMGPIEEPTTLRGMWKDRHLGNGQARRVANLLNRLRRLGSLVQVEWGAGSVGQEVIGESFTRRGVIAGVKFVLDRPQDIEWEVEFEWNGQGEVVAPAVLSNSLANPRQGLANLSSRYDDVLDSIQSFRTDVNTRIVGLSQPVTSALDAAEASLEISSEILLTGVGVATKVAEVPRQQIERAVSIAQKAIETIGAVEVELLQFDVTKWAVRDDVLDILRFFQGKFATLDTSGLAKGASVSTADELEGQLLPEIVAEVRATPGTDLRDLARQYYGDPDQWYVIAAFNGLVGSRVPDPPSANPADRQGRPIQVPRRQAGALGELRQAGC